MKTEKIKRNIIELDATDQAVGRLASKVVMTLRGKYKPGFVPHIDSGDQVVVINCGKVKFTGRKLVQKDFHHHSMHPGGLKTVSMKKVFDKDATKVMEHAIYGMMPKNRHRDQLMKRLTLKA